MTERAVHVLITGRVQGVSYRAWALGEADRLGLSGWVRNREDGAVEAVLSGSADAVEAMLAACRRGPPLAVVERVEVLGPAPPASGPLVVRT